MPVQDTSRSAYDELQPTLTARQRRILVGLGRYRDTVGEWPTSYELFDFLKRDDLVQDLNDCRPRLTELKEKGQVENPTIKRHCHITKKRAFTWRPTRSERLF